MGNQIKKRRWRCDIGIASSHYRNLALVQIANIDQTEVFYSIYSGLSTEVAAVTSLHLVIRELRCDGAALQPLTTRDL
jgi:hypothetical protein